MQLRIYLFVLVDFYKVEMLDFLIYLGRHPLVVLNTFVLFGLRDSNQIAVFCSLVYGRVLIRDTLIPLFGSPIDFVTCSPGYPSMLVSCRHVHRYMYYRSSRYIHFHIHVDRLESFSHLSHFFRSPSILSSDFLPPYHRFLLSPLPLVIALAITSSAALHHNRRHRHHHTITTSIIIISNSITVICVLVIIITIIIVMVVIVFTIIFV